MDGVDEWIMCAFGWRPSAIYAVPVVARWRRLEIRRSVVILLDATSHPLYQALEFGAVQADRRRSPYRPAVRASMM